MSKPRLIAFYLPQFYPTIYGAQNETYIED